MAQVNWGQPNVLDTETTGTWCRAMGGQFPSGITNPKLRAVYVYNPGPTHTAQLRVAVYQGGVLATGPDGADLIYDFGDSTGSETATWIAYNVEGSFPSLTVNTPTWIAFKQATGFSVQYSSDPADAGDFQSALGRFVSGGEVSSDPNVAYPDPWPADTGSFSDFWYRMYLVYSYDTYKLEGVTKDKIGNILGTCECLLFKDNLDNTLTFVGHDQSDGSGNYIFSGLTDNDAQYLVYSYKALTPHVFDVTDHELQPVVE